MTGYGQFVPLPPFPPVLYDKVRLLLIMGYLIFPLKSSPSPSDKMREKKESGSVCPVPRTEEDMATTNGVDQEIPPEVGRADSVGDGHDNDDEDEDGDMKMATTMVSTRRYHLRWEMKEMM